MPMSGFASVSRTARIVACVSRRHERTAVTGPLRHFLPCTPHFAQSPKRNSPARAVTTIRDFRRLPSSTDGIPAAVRTQREGENPMLKKSLIMAVLIAATAGPVQAALSDNALSDNALTDN